ncbi:hypothetical protein ACXM0N_07745 [Peribacillus simplex]
MKSFLLLQKLDARGSKAEGMQAFQKVFSMEFKEVYEIVGKPLETALRITVKRMRKIFCIPLWVPTKINREFKKAIQRLDPL